MAAEADADHGLGLTWPRFALSSVGLAAAARLIAGPLPLNYYDIGYALVWGREILHGQLPDYATPGASTPHPLGTLLATFAALLGSPGAWYAVQAIVLLSLGAAGTALFLLTRTCLARALAPARGATVGALVAVGALLLSPPFLTDALGGSGLSDMPALALVLAAAALAAENRRRAPLVLLGLAGLMRPEAWGLAVAWWLFLSWHPPRGPELLQNIGLVVGPPLLWALLDTIVVGDPAYSLTHTQAASQTGIFAHGIEQVPSAAARGLRALVGLPVLVFGGLGALAAVSRARRETAPALGLLGLALGEFTALGLANVPLLERFLLVVAAMTCLFFAFLALAGQRLGGRLLRGAWAAAAVVLVGYVAETHLLADAHVRRDQRAAVHAEVDLAALAAQATVRAALHRCSTLYVPRFTLTSLAAYDFDLPPQTILRTAARAPRRGLILAPATGAAGIYFGVTPARLAVLRRVTLAGAVAVAQNRSWAALTRGC